MGQWIGRGKWVFSSEEKKEYRLKKQKDFNAMVAVHKKRYLTKTHLKTFLTDKQIEEHFKQPDNSVRLSNGSWMYQYDYVKVLAKLKKKKLVVKLKKGFEDIPIDEVKIKVRNLQSILLFEKLEKKLPPKGVTEKPKKI